MVIRVFLHFLRNSLLVNKSILKGTLGFFLLFLLQERLRNLLLRFTSICLYPLSIISTPEEYIKKFPSISQMSTLFHPLDLSVHKLIENHAPDFHQKKGDNAFPLELLGFGGFLIFPPPLPPVFSFEGKGLSLIITDMWTREFYLF